MGQSSSSQRSKVNETLQVVFKGKTVGSLPKGVEGAILSNHTYNLDTRALWLLVAGDRGLSESCPLEVSSTIRDSLGDPKALTIITPEKDDLEAFTVSLKDVWDPTYVPFFFDRKGEYGAGHNYLEALCHAIPTRDVIETASARYFKRDGTAIITKHPPATIEMAAFVEAIRDLNAPFLAKLRQKLIDYKEWKTPIPEYSVQDAVDDFLFGAFRNIAIQYHSGGKSKTVEQTIHQDHVFSALHMGVTLNGRRDVGFATGLGIEWPPQFLILKMQEGDCYVSTPAAILHGVATEDLPDTEISIAFQCRNLLSAKGAKFWNDNRQQLCGHVAELLAITDFIIPNISQLKAKADEIRKKAPNSSAEFKSWDFVNPEGDE